MNILALDLATKTGWALRENGRIESGVETFDLRRGDSPGMRWIRFRRWMDDIAGDRFKPDLIVFERWVRGINGASGEITAGFTTRVVEFCTERKIEHTAVSPSDLKRWATGRGNAKKADMLEAVERRFGRRVDDDNEADAIALLYYVIAELVPR